MVKMKNQSRERGPTITPEVEALIASVYRRHPKWKGPQIRNWVIAELHKKSPNLRREYPNWPSLSKVQKILAEVRENAAKPNREDEPWSISTLKDFPIPPEALPKILEEYKWHKEGQVKHCESEVLGAFLSGKGPVLTIREAKWISRLSKIKCDTSLPYVIAWAELLCELTGHQLDFEGLDKLLAGIKVETEDLTNFVMYFGRLTFDHFFEKGDTK